MDERPETQRQQEAEVLAHQAERIRNFLELSAEGLWCVESTHPIPVEWSTSRQVDAILEWGYIAECNDAMARMYGLSTAADLMGVPLRELLPRTEPRNLTYLSVFVESGYRLIGGESVEPDRSGRLHHYLNNLVGVVQEGHLMRAWGTQVDITERRRLEEQLRQSQKLEAIGLLAGGVAHDFNNALTAILAACDLAQHRLAHGGDPSADLTTIRRAAEHSAELTGQLLAFGRRRVMRPRTVDLREVVENLRPMLERLLGRGVRFEVELGDEACRVFADVSALEQVILNLCVNARDAMPDGGRLLVSTRAPGGDLQDRVRLRVEDDGEGIAPDVIARVFDPFFTTKPDGRGTGLGLSMVHGLVAQSGGEVRVESEPGRGARFDVLLPAAPEAIEG